MNRFRWYFKVQGGTCALRQTEGCKNRGGGMTEPPAKRVGGGRQPFDTATWDHIYPKPQRVTPEDSEVQLLACAQCNHTRGAKPPTAAYIARGLDLLARWKAYRDEVIEQAALRKEKRKQLNRLGPDVRAAHRLGYAFCALETRAHLDGAVRHLAFTPGEKRVARLARREGLSVAECIARARPKTQGGPGR